MRTTTCCSAGTFGCPHKMNTIPHSRATRYFFYNDVTSSVTETLSRHQGKRMAVNFLIPETNPANDVFRVGTLLELLRTLAGGIVADGKRCKICVQGSMGKGTFQGLPLQLSGLRKLLDLMDWEPEVAPFVSFGAVKEEDVEDQDVYIVVCPQNIVGASIIPDLKSFAERAEERGAQVILMNPNLVDIPSSGGLMQVRGREERMSFVEDFEEIYHFRLLYRKPYFHPIFGCLRYAGPGKGYEVYKRVVKKDTETGEKEEKYCFTRSFDRVPGPPQITDCISMSVSF